MTTTYYMLKVISKKEIDPDQFGRQVGLAVRKSDARGVFDNGNPVLQEFEILIMEPNLKKIDETAG